MANLRSGLLGEIVTMSVDTLRANKMRSALTVLGVVIGIMSIVGMTSLIRGFDESLRDSIRALGPNTIMTNSVAVPRHVISERRHRVRHGRWQLRGGSPHGRLRSDRG